ncbi:MAG: thioredoxin family protein [Candidatus Cloacimonadaceae bacterium]|nr:thioredoxin family protein [Candidatus Cloacimonadaceae bacterium]
MRSHAKMLMIMIALALAGMLPGTQSVKFSLDKASLKPGEKGILRATLSIPEGKKQSHDPKDLESSYFYLIGENSSLSFGKHQYPKPDKISEDGFWEYYKSLTLTLPFTVKAIAKAGKTEIKAEMSYGLCHAISGFCDPPVEALDKVSLEILAAEEVPLAPSTETGSEEKTPSEPDTTESIELTTAETLPETEVPPAGTTTKSIIFYMLMAILGGIVLNATPCVLPILPIRAMSMINQAQKDITKLFLHTMIYTLGVLLSFGSIAAAFVIARLSGVNLTYGFLNQSLTYNLIMLSIIFVFGLSLLGVFVMNAPGQNTASKATSRKGYTGSFFWGVFAFLMGFSCMGPFMGPALEVAVRLSSPLLVVFFLLIGLGFALPFVIISMYPRALKWIPKPGEWMNIFKELMGFVLMLLVFKYFSTLWGLTRSGAYLLSVSHYVIFLGFAAWLYGRFVRMEHSKAVQFIFTLLAVGVIALSAYTYLPFMEETKVIQTTGDLQPADHDGWYVFSPQLFDKLQAEGKPVFLDIGADWCANCKVNERKVLHQDDIMREFAEKGVVLLKGDFTRKDPVLLDWIQKGGSIGVPFNVLYIPGKSPIKMSELFSKSDIRKALEQIPLKEAN